MEKLLSGKTIVVTGSTRGIGRDIAGYCAAQGANVVLSARNEVAGRIAVREITQRGESASFIRCQIDRPEDCEDLIEQCVKCFGRIDGLVNNAGIFPRGDLLESTPEQYIQVFDINFKGAFFCTQYAVKAMLETGGGSIVTIGSTHAYGGEKDLALYGCSKGALLSMTRYLAKNYAGNRIRSNWVTVGWVISDGERDRLEQLGYDMENIEKEGLRVCPLGRLQTGEDIAHSVGFLLSEQAAMITGTEIHVTGGFRPL